MEGIWTVILECLLTTTSGFACTILTKMTIIIVGVNVAFSACILHILVQTPYLVPVKQGIFMHVSDSS